MTILETIRTVSDAESIAANPRPWSIPAPADALTRHRRYISSRARGLRSHRRRDPAG
jgi:hypothetical protein